MKVPYFSVVIPTRHRGWLAGKAVESVEQQTFQDFELLILENSSDAKHLAYCEPDTAARKTIHSASVLSMPDNWERGLDHVCGKYVLYISDKDRLVPTALQKLYNVTASDDCLLLNYRKATYFEKDSRLYLHDCDGSTGDFFTKDVLADWFSYVNHMHNAPMIYNSAVSNSVLQTLRKAETNFFCSTCPDVSSGVLLCAQLNYYRLIEEVLCVANFGTWSNGLNSLTFGRSTDTLISARKAYDPFESRQLVYGVSGAVAETLLACKEEYAELLGSFEIAWSSYIYHTLAEIDKRQSGRQVKKEERRMLRNSERYSARAYTVARMRYGHAQLQSRILQVLRALGIEKGSSGGKNLDCGGMPWRDPVFVHSLVANSIDEAYRLVVHGGCSKVRK